MLSYFDFFRESDPYTKVATVDSGWEIQMGIPGAKKANFQIEVRDSKLAVQYSPDKDSFLQEKVSRRYYLPEGTEEVQATCADGLLRILVPRRSPSVRQIAIH